MGGGCGRALPIVSEPSPLRRICAQRTWLASLLRSLGGIVPILARLAPLSAAVHRKGFKSPRLQRAAALAGSRAPGQTGGHRDIAFRLRQFEDPEPVALVGSLLGWAVEACRTWHAPLLLHRLCVVVVVSVFACIAQLRVCPDVVAPLQGQGWAHHAGSICGGSAQGLVGSHAVLERREERAMGCQGRAGQRTVGARHALGCASPRRKSAHWTFPACLIGWSRLRGISVASRRALLAHHVGSVVACKEKGNSNISPHLGRLLVHSWFYYTSSHNKGRVRHHR